MARYSCHWRGVDRSSVVRTKMGGSPHTYLFPTPVITSTRPLRSTQPLTSLTHGPPPNQSNWLDAKADRSDADHRRRLRTLGSLLALSVTNACRLPVELPDLFFRWLVLGGAGAGEPADDGLRKSLSSSSPSPSPPFEPSVADMVALDPSLARPFEALKDAVESADALEGLLDIEGLPADTPAGEYISHMVRQTFLDPVQWQITEVRGAFFRALPALAAGVKKPPSDRWRGRSGGSAPAARLPRPAVLAEIIRGCSPVVGDSSYGGGGGGGGGGPLRSSSGKTIKDFDFREAFAVYEDRDLVACAPLREVHTRRRDSPGSDRRDGFVYPTMQSSPLGGGGKFYSTVEILHNGEVIF